MQSRKLYEQEEWDLGKILTKSKRFRHIPRVSAISEDFKAAFSEYRNSGIPLVIEGLHNHPRWSQSLFNPRWFRENGPQALVVRDVDTRNDIKLSVSEFLGCCDEPDLGRNRPTYYAKDAECPDLWRRWLSDSGVIPSYLAPLGTNDLFKHLPATTRPETLMCYLGTGGTYTPCHKDLCGSSGHNLMVFAKDSSAFWFMTKSSDAPAVAQYFRKKLRQIIDWEHHTITIDELALAPFDVYICEQQLGDFVLVPPRSCHQVVNHGGLTIKLSWSRITLKGAEIALYHELPLYRRVCRAEIYRIKSLIHHALRWATAQCEVAFLSGRIGDGPTDDLSALVRMFHAVIVDEYHPEQLSFPNTAESEDSAYSVSCDFCGGDILVSFFECTACPAVRKAVRAVDRACERDVHLCPGCVAEGRSCGCTRTMKAMQSWPYEALQSDFNRAVRALRAHRAVEWQELGPREDPCPLTARRSAGLFKAAVVINEGLFSARRNKDMIQCYSTYKESHAVISAHTVHCHQCHRGKCFSHWAEKGIHSSAIAGVVAFHDKGIEWHRRHQEPRAMDGERLLEAERAGDRIPTEAMPERLALLARKFPDVQPLRHGLTAGYYDRRII